MNHVITETTATFTTVTKPVDQVALEIAPPQPCFVADFDGEVAGYTRYFTFRGGPGYAHIAEYSIALTSAAQGTGVGREMLACLSKHALDNGITQLVGAVSGDNLAAIKFHLATGFTQVGHLPDAGQKWGKSLDLIFMQKRL